MHACLMFGRGRFQNGVLIQPKEQFDPNDEAKLEEFRNKIWLVQILPIVTPRGTAHTCACLSV